MPVMQIENAAQATLGDETVFDFMPPSDVIAAGDAEYGAVGEDPLRHAQVSRMTIGTFEFTAQTLHHFTPPREVKKAFYPFQNAPQ
ncbi:hypothetical protein CU100_24395 [Phyllobacterium endophyticum]|uniref:Uncharacterized protein n=1 Tax=Phyllobacterium endophyticum TaxID=1149773 RepID=A0A2P7ALX9_9HYPH|nr:hypothetical protein CU100_24395 [Phyllobacterium endophyticum]